MGARLEAEVLRIRLLEQAQEELLAYRRAQGQTEDNDEDLENDAARPEWEDADAFDPGIHLQQDPATCAARLAAQIDGSDAPQLQENAADLAANIQFAALGFSNVGAAEMTDAKYERNKGLMSDHQKVAFFAVVEHVQSQR